MHETRTKREFYFRAKIEYSSSSYTRKTSLVGVRRSQSKGVFFSPKTHISGKSNLFSEIDNARRLFTDRVVFKILPCSTCFLRTPCSVHCQYTIGKWNKNTTILHDYKQRLRGKFPRSLTTNNRGGVSWGFHK